MLRNKTVLKIFSVIFAVLLWMYIIAEVNPLVTRTLHNIPVQVLNEQVLEQQGLTVEDAQSFTADLTVEVRRGDLHRLNKEKPTAEIDVSGCRKGLNTLPIAVKMPSVASLSEASPVMEVNVVVEMAAKEVALKTELHGTPPEGYTLKKADIPKAVRVAGPKLELNALTEIEAKPVDISKVRKKTSIPMKVIFPPQVQLAKGQPEPRAVIDVEKE